MSFQWPAALMILIVPALSVIYGASRRAVSILALPRIKRGRARRGRVSLESETLGSARLRTPWLLLIAAVCAIIALARPQWGAEREGTVSTAEVLIALDLSRSMLSSDVVPSRLERARGYALRLIDRMPDRKIGLMVFAGAPYLIDPPSSDHAAMLATLPHLMPADLVQQGTDLAALLDAAAAGFTPTSTSRTLILLSDGEAESTAWSTQLASLRRDGVRVFAVGCGTADGAPVPGSDGRWLRTASGALVQSRLNAAALAGIADETRGRYRDLADAAGLLRDIRAAPAGGLDAVGERRADRFVWFLAASLLSLALSCIVEIPAMPTLRRPALRRSAIASAALTIAGGVLLASLTLHSHYSMASAAEADEEDVDALEPLKAVVAGVVAKHEVGAADYLELVRATVRYGDVQRNQSGAVSPGIFSDGMAALAEGHRLAPRLADWAGLEAALRRLAVPPPAVPDDRKPPDAANERLGGSRQATQVGGPRDAGNGKERDEASSDNDAAQQPGDSKGESAAAKSLHSIGGSRRRVYDASEWRDPSLVLPLHELDRLRDSDSPAALFRAVQTATATSPARAQTW
jgi:Ca-activated chloride channel family protein